MDSPGTGLSVHERKILGVAKICHEANRAFCETMGDYSHAPWDNSDVDQQDLMLEGVMFALTGPREVDELHENWRKKKEDQGWTYGLVKNQERKEHPNMKDFELLPFEEQMKNALFLSIVIGMSPALARSAAKPEESLQ